MSIGMKYCIKKGYCWDMGWGQDPLGLEGSGAFGAVGIGSRTWAVLSCIPEG